ncbi:MAG: hypothetical protein GX621_12875 [Pirellulaceae bacterium]|nr:hypothetical protein [Pirellulaceae bacterium]
MIAINKSAATPNGISAQQQAFVTMLPKIVEHARHAFRHHHAEARDDAVAEVVANAFAAYTRLVELDKSELAYPSALARFGVAQFRDGRRFGTSRNGNEVMSRYSQKKKDFRVRSLDRPEGKDAKWTEAVTVDTRSMPVDETVAFRLDFLAWLKQLTRRNRRVAEHLAVGNRGLDAAKKFRISTARISQLRDELAASWAAFRGDDVGVRRLDPAMA